MKTEDEEVIDAIMGLVAVLMIVLALLAVFYGFIKQDTWSNEPVTEYYSELA